MTELQFLIDLLLNHKLTKPTKDAIASRIKEVESLMAQQPRAQVIHSPYIPQQTIARPSQAQSPSTQRILDEMAREGKQLGSEQANNAQPAYTPEQQGGTQGPSPVPVSQVAQTAATAQALAARNAAISIAISGKEEKGRTSPRKF